MKAPLALVLVFSTLGCINANMLDSQGNPPRAHASADQSPNFLILVADDMGIENLREWGVSDRNATTPTLSRLATQGMRFEQFWSQPVCSPMRVSTLTGRYSFRHGVSGPLFGIDKLIGLAAPHTQENAIPSLDFSPMGGPIPVGKQPPIPSGNGPPGPDPSELFLPSVLKSINPDYATAAFGKWHMASYNNGGVDHPNLVGFDHFAGPIDGVVTDVSAWLHVENGKARYEFGYVDQKSTDDATTWIAEQHTPWMVWFSFVNPHEPFHKPPSDLIQTESLKNLDPNGMSNDNTSVYFKAMIEAMDSLSGQIIASIPKDQIDNTYIIWLADNGDEHNARPPDQRRPNTWKTTNYQGGVHVPFIIKGPGIKPGTSNTALAHVVDIFGTVIELAGGDLGAVVDRTIDSVPFAEQILGAQNPSVRDWNYSDVKIFGLSQTIRNARYKLIRNGKTDLLFDLISDPDESINRLSSPDVATQEAYRSLSSMLDSLLASESAQGAND